ncbi:MAG: MEKHLA domain-containing protein [Acidobacteriota bacterium]|nr:MEKHLA domain-containing protein [Acidobacteriota bacterium]
MASDDEEAQRLRSVALQNAHAILLARQRAERELAAERERLRITLASIGDAVISTDALGRVEYLNAVAETLTRWTQAEAAGRPLLEVFQIVNEYTRQPAENPALQALRDRVVVGLANHTVLIARDGTERPIDDSAAPMLDESGVPVGVVLVFRDVTERRRAEEAQARLAAIVESSQDAIISKTLQGVIRTWNTGAERLFEYSAEEVLGQPITLIIPPERLDEEEMILAQIARGERIERYETVRVAKGGRRLHISLTVSPVRDVEGRIIGASKVAHDITERKEAEAALRASELRFRTLTAHAPVGIFTTDRDGNCLFVNERWCEIAGLSPEEARGQGWTRALHPDDRERIFHAWYTAAEAGRPFAEEYRFRTPEGRVRWLQGNAIALCNDAGQAGGYIGTLTDITPRREAVEALQEADRRKDEFLALLAHELRNPLAPLRNGLQVMRLASGDAKIVTKTQEMMDRQLSHMVRLIDDLLDVSRISRNKMELRRSPVLLADVVSCAVETARPALGAGGQDLTVSLPPEPILLDADLTRLAQVLGNLLNNSAKYTERGGRIWLAATRDGDQVLVTVEDTGIGIPASALPSIFDMFSQVDRSIERSTGGLGIGLALVKGVVEMHGGTVEAASPGEGRGSTFTLRLPIRQDRTEALPEEPAAARPDSAAGSKRRILVVDDNRDSATSMAMMLQLLGNEIRTAEDGIEAVELAEQFRPQVILMDIGMPRLNGYEATRRIREQPWGRDMKVIALTGWGQDIDRQKSSEAGCEGHLVKPINWPDLEKLLIELQGGNRSVMDIAEPGNG